MRISRGARIGKVRVSESLRRRHVEWWRRPSFGHVANVAKIEEGELQFAPDTGDDLVVNQGAAKWMGRGGPVNVDDRRDPGFGVPFGSSIGCRRSQTGGYSMGVVGVAVFTRQGRTPTGLQDALERLCRSGP